jgi:hypothetical protein
MNKIITINPKRLREFRAGIFAGEYHYLPANVDIFLDDIYTDRDFAKAFARITTEAIIFYRGYEDMTLDMISIIIRNTLRAYNKEVGQRVFTAHGYKKIAEKLIKMANEDLMVKGHSVVWEYMQHKLQERGLY